MIDNAKENDLETNGQNIENQKDFSTIWLKKEPVLH